VGADVTVDLSDRVDQQRADGYVRDFVVKSLLVELLKSTSTNPILEIPTCHNQTTYVSIECAP
jgi:hypothetical protein